MEYAFCSVQYSAPPPIFTDELKDVKVKIGDIIILGCKGNILMRMIYTGGNLVALF